VVEGAGKFIDCFCHLDEEAAILPHHQHHFRTLRAISLQSVNDFEGNYTRTLKYLYCTNQWLLWVAPITKKFVQQHRLKNGTDSTPIFVRFWITLSEELQQAWKLIRILDQILAHPEGIHTNGHLVWEVGGHTTTLQNRLWTES
jgi:hypothetical protein